MDSPLEGDGFELPVPREKARYPIGAQLILLWLQPRAYETISVAPIAGALGAEVSGVDLARKLPDATIAEIRQALLTHLVIFYGGTQRFDSRLLQERVERTSN